MLILPWERYPLVHALGRKKGKEKEHLMSMMDMFSKPPDLLPILLHSDPQLTSCDLSGLSS